MLLYTNRYNYVASWLSMYFSLLVDAEESRRHNGKPSGTKCVDVKVCTPDSLAREFGEALTKFPGTNQLYTGACVLSSLFWQFHAI